MAKRIAGWGFIAMAFAVAIHTVIEPLYHVSTAAQPYSPFWMILDPFMVVALVAGTILAYRRKRAVDGEGDDAPVSRAYIAANTLFYGFLGVGILLFWSYLNLLNPGYAPTGTDAESVIWMLIDASLPLLLGAQGFQLVRGAF
ncbi:MAG: hypothetical protein OXU77_01075 [Gammaproteobacteria bacterium]|nr:hypothetical protein [Gammaproteobacteria bacterium]MDE0444398.1 hypothetical protein [Gammaproteobacteria bacterium]